MQAYNLEYLGSCSRKFANSTSLPYTVLDQPKIHKTVFVLKKAKKKREEKRKEGRKVTEL